MKSTLRSQRDTLEKLWEQGLSGQSLLRDHSRLADDFIQECFQGIDVPKVGESVALVALGGYGRQELFPFSDIDIMVLYHKRVKKNVEKIADAIFYPLWDTGLEVGHGVRTIKESMALAGEDFIFQVAMLDARLLCGSEKLFDELQRTYRKKFIDGRREKFVETMKQFRDERRSKFGSHSYLLEPHIKEGKGGMRDIQAMLWTAKVVFGLDGLDSIAQGGILLEQEQEAFALSWNVLTRIRNRLHYISKRKNDQLYFEQQEEMAEAFGYKNRGGMLGVESFMRDLYGHLQVVAVTTDLFFEHVDEVLGLSNREGGAVADKKIEKGIELRKGRIHLVASRAELEAKPHILMRVFLASARTGRPIHHRTRRTVTTNLDLVTEKVRSSPRMTAPFFDILVNGKDVFTVLEVMLETGMLTTFIPEYSRIITLTHHDIYHIYTVDRHSLQALQELRQVVEEEPTVFDEGVDSPEVLYLAALLHDIGKGAGGDHSEIGAELVKGIGVRMGLSAEQCARLSFVVQYHLFVPENALRRDLNDGAFIERCADLVGDRDRLTMLYLLSIADSRATGPSAWSEWKAALMLEMYLKILAYFQSHQLGGAGAVEAQVEQGVDWLRMQVAELLRGEEGLLVDVSSLTGDYLLGFTPDEVAEHILLHRDNHRVVRQKSLVQARDDGEQWSLLVMSSDRPGLLAKICGVMALNGLSVMNARIFTWADGTAVDVIDVRPVDGLGFAEKDWQALNRDLDMAVNHRLGLGHRLYQKMASSYGRQKDMAARQDSRVVLDNEASDEYTVVEVYSGDFPGQLYSITQTLADFGINIHKAFIATEVEQLIDVFYVLDGHGEKIIDVQFQKEIEQGLLHAVGMVTS